MSVRNRQMMANWLPTPIQRITLLGGGDTLCSRCHALSPSLFAETATQNSLSHSTGFSDVRQLRESAQQNNCRVCKLMVSAIEVEPDMPPLNDRDRRNRRAQRSAVVPRGGKSATEGIQVRRSCVSTYGARLTLLEILLSEDRIGRLHFTTGPELPGDGADDNSNAPMRAVAASPDCGENYALIRSWLDRCAREHRGCNITPLFARGFSLPTRVLDVRPVSRGEDFIRLVYGADVVSNESGERYLALSHRWGDGGASCSIPQTTSKNLQARTAGIPMDELSKTFRDAVQITRALGVRYLWIDSMCIVQGDKQDWEREAGKMHQVYACAYLTVAASESNDSNGGCFIDRDADRIAPCKLQVDDKNGEPLVVTLYPTLGSWEDVERGPLAARGWIFQEFQLSRRIIHYTKNRILWQCSDANGNATEDQPAFQVAWSSSKPRRGWRLASTTVSADERGCVLPVPHGEHVFMHPMPETLDTWYSGVEDYSRRKLTYPTDKLPALAGVAAAISAYSKQEYFAGIWAGDVVRGLMWEPDDEGRPLPKSRSIWPKPPVEPLAPSWSWAAFDGLVRYRYRSPYTFRIYLGELQVHCDITMLGGNEFGRVESAQIRVLGIGMEVAVSERSHCFDMKSEGGPKCYGMFTGLAVVGKMLWRKRLRSIVDGIIYFDTDPYRLKKTKFLCLRLGTAAGRLGNGVHVLNKTTDVGLTLMAADGGDNVFRRVGLFEVAHNNELWYNGSGPKSLMII